MPSQLLASKDYIHCLTFSWVIIVIKCLVSSSVMIIVNDIPFAVFIFKPKVPELNLQLSCRGSMNEVGAVSIIRVLSWIPWALKTHPACVRVEGKVFVTVDWFGRLSFRTN